MVSLMKDLLKKGLKIAYVCTWTGGGGAIYAIGRGEEALADPFCIDLERLKKLYKTEEITNVHQKANNGCSRKGI